MSLSPEKVLEKSRKSIDRAFEVLTNPKESKKIAKEIKDQIVKRSLLGYGVDPGTRARVKFPKLSDSYIEQRKGNLRFFTAKAGHVYPVKIKSSRKPPKKTGKKRAKKAKGAKKAKSKKAKTRVGAPNLSPKTRPAKSNITATGLLLKSLEVTGGIKKAIISVKNIRYKKNIFGENIKNPPTTREVVRFLEKSNRTFLLLTKTEKKRVERNLGKRILDLARKFNESS